MIADIEIPEVVGVSLAIVQEANEDVQGQEPGAEWRVYILNQNDFALENIIIASRGYGQDSVGNKINTSTLRHVLPELPAQSYAPVELIAPEVFHLVNEYWVSYYHQGQLYDKKFLFMPESIRPENMQHIEFLASNGILHI